MPAAAARVWVNASLTPRGGSVTSTPVLITHEDQVAVVHPVGGRVIRYDVAGTPVLIGDEHPHQFAYRGSLLAPWPNRVTDGS